MAPCLARVPDPLRQPPPNAGAGAFDRRRKLHHSYALRVLNQPTTPNNLKAAHAHLIRHHLAHHPAVIAKLLRLYSSHHLLPHAAALFSLIPNPPTHLYNLMIRAYTHNSAPLAALLLYNHMITTSVPPDKFTFPFAAAACSHCANFPKGKEIHASAIKARFFNDIYVQNVLIHMYYSCGDSVSARQVFNGMRARTVVSWTALVSGLVDCGEMGEAREVFEVMPVRNVVTWTVMIDGCARSGRPEEAFELFRRMLEEGVKPNEFTIVGLLIACTELGSLSLGRWVHDFARKNSMARGVYVGTSLIDMYSKCGSLEDAKTVFSEMPVRSLATWNSMIISLGVHQCASEAIALFREMEMANVRPDRITFVGLLYACVKAGLVEEGLELFRYMSERYGIVAEWEHYSCLVELFSSADGFDKVSEMVKSLAMELDVESQRMLLGASRAHGHAEVEKAVWKCIREVASVDGQDPLPRIENQCYEWEVG